MARFSIVFLASIIVAAAAPAHAQVIALAPTPHDAQCEDFTHEPNGMWRPNGPIMVGNGMQMGPGVSFSEGASFGGIDIAHVLNEHCTGAHGANNGT